MTPYCHSVTLDCHSVTLDCHSERSEESPWSASFLLLHNDSIWNYPLAGVVKDLIVVGMVQNALASGPKGR